MADPSTETERHIARFNQNSEHFRGLNSQMWQIPIIGMTLTGGLWFGVSSVKDSPAFQISLLALAIVGNLALIFVLFRLRFVMGSYLEWLNANEPEAKINPDGQMWYEKSYFVRNTFQVVLGLAAVISLVLAVVTYRKASPHQTHPVLASAYYEDAARFAGNQYLQPDFARAHPRLAHALAQARPLDVLVLGSGAARDAMAIRQLGHRVIVSSLSPADAALLSRTAGPGAIRTSLPNLAELARLGRRIDVVVGNDAWSTLSDEARVRFIDAAGDLLRDDGSIELLLLSGGNTKGDVPRPSTESEMARGLAGTGMVIAYSDQLPDLLGRSGISWHQVTITKSSAVAKKTSSSARI